MRKNKEDDRKYQRDYNCAKRAARVKIGQHTLCEAIFIPCSC